MGREKGDILYPSERRAHILFCLLSSLSHAIVGIDNKTELLLELNIYVLTTTGILLLFFTSNLSNKIKLFLSNGLKLQNLVKHCQTQSVALWCVLFIFLRCDTLKQDVIMSDEQKVFFLVDSALSYNNNSHINSHTTVRNHKRSVD